MESITGTTHALRRQAGQPGKSKGPHAITGNAHSNIDAEYEALCAEYEGALV